MPNLHLKTEQQFVGFADMHIMKVILGKGVSQVRKWGHMVFWWKKKAQIEGD